VLAEGRKGDGSVTTGRISKRAVDALRYKAGRDRQFLWDDALAGFGVADFPPARRFTLSNFERMAVRAGLPLESMVA
jgi:hypothetical protein